MTHRLHFCNLGRAMRHEGFTAGLGNRPLKPREGLSGPPYRPIPDFDRITTKTAGCPISRVLCEKWGILGTGPHVSNLTWQHHEKGCPTHRAFRRVGTMNLDGFSPGAPFLASFARSGDFPDWPTRFES